MWLLSAVMHVKLDSGLISLFHRLMVFSLHGYGSSHSE